MNSEIINIPSAKSWEEYKEISESYLEIIHDDEKIQKLNVFYSLLKETNEKINLTRLIELEDFLTFHLLDTGLLAKVLRDLKDFSQTAKIKYLDLGSGCGVPGIVLSVLLNYESSTLVEAIGKKASFLSETVKELNMTEKILVLGEHTKELEANPEVKGVFNLITARAFAKPQKTLLAVLPFLKRQDGIFLAQSATKLTEDKEYLTLLEKHKLSIRHEAFFSLGGRSRVVSVIGAL